jgi:L-alanine-DL-glutamate epimerase-like enolase superfamily enzyme
MKITDIDVIPVGIPYSHDAPAGSDPDRALMRAVYVRVGTDAGIAGWGEVFGFGAASCAMAEAAFRLVVEPLALGRQADDIPALMTALFRRTQGSSLKGPVRNALGALDIALWDIRGKAEGQPIWRLLGGDGSRLRVPAYASLLRTGHPDHVARLCASARRRGYRHIKLHERNDEAVACVARARETVGADIGLMLDANCTWLPDEVTAKARALLPYGLTWLEEPVYPPDDFATLARLRAEAGIPVAAGENLGTVQEFGRMIDAGAVDYIQPDVGKFGGISEMIKAAHMAQARGVAFMPHSPLFGPVLISTLHILAAIEDEGICESYYCDLAESPMGGWATPTDGYFRIPDAPGLGVSVDEDALARHRQRSSVA